VLRDVTERVVIASKGRFDRALTPAKRLERGLPSTATISRDEFMEATTDLWEISPESATRVGHPAPFPVELPKRLIELYTYEGDVVLDPFMGSGSTAVAALGAERHYIGFDTDAGYLAIAEQRIAEERRRIEAAMDDANRRFRVELPAVGSTGESLDFQTRAVREGRQAREIAEILLGASGFEDIRAEVKPRGLGIVLSFVASDQSGEDWAFDVSGAFTTSRAGLRRAETLWRSLAKAAVLHESQVQAGSGGQRGLRLVLLTTDAPAKGTAGHQALRVMRGEGRPVFDVIEILNADDQARLRAYASGIRELPQAPS
jgi:site-specific DNA-methyltransferase (adenine-specific)